MRILVTGGAASGKSDYAEDLVMEWEGPRYYLATMSSLGYEAQQRIDRHVSQREGKGFVTLDIDEIGTSGVLAALAERPGAVLLEDLGNLVSRFLYSRQGTLLDEEDAFERVIAFIDAVERLCGNLVIVCSRVGADGIPYASHTAAYVSMIGRVSCAVAAASGTVIEVVSGQPVIVKKETVSAS